MALILAISIAWASQYSPGVMEQVIENRQAGLAWVSLPDPLPQADGHIAVEDCRQLGRIWKIRPLGRPKWERHIVVDCSGSESTSAWMRKNNIALEVSYETARRWGTVGRGVRVEIGQYATHTGRGPWLLP